jgi:hypothetical protein
MEEHTEVENGEKMSGYKNIAAIIYDVRSFYECTFI